jgi:transcriptional regulator with XRE-family HTH domain
MGEAVHDDLAKSVGAALSRRRKSANYTQARAADALGLEKETISRIETGAISPTLHRLAQFARLYGCPIATFFSGSAAESGADAAKLAALLDGVDADGRARILRVAEEMADQCRRVQLLESALAERAQLEAALPDRPLPRRAPKRL